MFGFQQHLSDSFYFQLEQAKNKSPICLLSALYFYSLVNNNNFGKQSYPFNISLSDLPYVPLSTFLFNQMKYEFEKTKVEKSLMESRYLDEYFKETKLSKPDNITVIDIWAQWCGACRISNSKAITQFIKRVNKAKGKIDFISISIDKDSLNWKKATKEDNIFWKNILFLSTEGNLVPDFIQNNGIPLYFIMNKEEEIIKTANNLEEILFYLEANNYI